MTSRLSQGETVFPNVPIQHLAETSYAFPEDTKTVDGFWLVACVAYQANFAPQVHHTKLWFLSVPINEAAAPAPIASGQNITWQPIGHFVLTDSEAD